MSENVSASFAPCSESEIKHLARRHNFMLSFRPCGNNHFTEYRWSPNGESLYFQLSVTGYIMDASVPTKNTRIVPTPTPVTAPAWLDSSRLALAVGPSEESKGAGPHRLALFETGGSLFFHDFPADLDDFEDLVVGDESTQVLFSAVRGAERSIYTMDTNTGTVEPAFPWLKDSVDNFTYTPSQNTVAIAKDNAVTLHDAKTGAPRGSWSPALRGSLHPDGIWMMLEHEGEPISIFYQRHWDELPPEARERELRRAKRFEENLPENMPTEVRPPTLSFANPKTGARSALSSVYGHDFTWYGPTRYYGSFILWGFEGKQMKRNVMLGNFVDRMRSADEGREFMGVDRLDGDAYSYTAPSEPYEALKPAEPELQAPVLQPEAAP